MEIEPTNFDVSHKAYADVLPQPLRQGQVGGGGKIGVDRGYWQCVKGAILLAAIVEANH